MLASRYYRAVAEADDIGREVGRPLRQAGLRRSAEGGCVPLPGSEAQLSLYERGGWWDAAPLLDDGCPLKSRCTTGPERRITRWEHEHVREAVQQRLDKNPQAMRLRRETAEHPFGTREMRMGATSDEEPAEGCDRDVPARPRL
jgi:hypothetical protein